MWKAFRQIWVLVRPHKAQVFWAFFFGGLIAVLSPLLPALVQLLLKGLEGDKAFSLEGQNLVNQTLVNWVGPWIRGWSPEAIDSRFLVRLCAVAIPVFYFIYGCLRYIHFYLIKYASEKIVSDVRIRLMDTFLYQDVSFVDRKASGSGGLLSRTLNDTLVLQMGLQYYADLIREPFVALFIIGFMFTLSWKLTAACLVFLPVFLFVIRYVSKSLKKYGHQSQESLEEVTKTLKEGMDGVKVIQSFNLQPTVGQKFRVQVLDYLNKRRKIIKREEIGSPLNEWFASLLISGICLFQASLIWRGESDASTFIAFLVAAGLLDKPVKKTQQAVIRIQQNVVALERIQEVLDSRADVAEPENPKIFPKNWETIEFKNLGFSYGDKKVLSDFSLKVKKGEVVALVGESGSGKSTLVSLLLRFFDPQEGDILIDGVSIKQFSIEDLRIAIGLVTQDVFLFDDTVENNIWFGDQKKKKDGVVEALKYANALDFVENSVEGKQSRAGERGNRFSGGEKQRISIARAMFKDAPILILDEATSALDSASEIQVQKGLQHLLKGRTAFVIAHRLSTISNSDRIVVMKSGSIIEQGTHDSLLAKNGAYAGYHQMQFDR